VLTTERLVLRRLRPTDLDAVFAIHADPRTNAFNPRGPDRTLDDARERLAGWIAHWDEHGFGYWAIERRDQPGVIGVGGVQLRDGVLNLYYRFAVEAWGHGFATEMAEAARGFARQDGRRLVALIRPDNAPSIKVAERIGLRRVPLVPLDDGRALYA